MADVHPSVLRLRVRRPRPRLTLTEIQLVDGALLYRRLDARDHVLSDVRAVRPSASDWAELRRVLDEAEFWSWPRRWPRVDDHYAGEFVIAVEWAGQIAVSAGALGVAREVDDVFNEVQRLVTGARRRSSAPVPTLRRPTQRPMYLSHTPSTPAAFSAT